MNSNAVSPKKVFLLMILSCCFIGVDDLCAQSFNGSQVKTITEVDFPLTIRQGPYGFKNPYNRAIIHSERGVFAPFGSVYRLLGHGWNCLELLIWFDDNRYYVYGNAFPFLYLPNVEDVMAIKYYPKKLDKQERKDSFESVYYITKLDKEEFCSYHLVF